MTWMTTLMITVLAWGGPQQDPQGSGSVTGGWWDDVYEQKTVELTEILKSPLAYRGLDVSFVVQFEGLRQVENPYYTNFEKDRFVNFSGWPDGDPLWVKSSHDDAFRYLFVDRGTDLGKEILAAEKFDRFIVTGRVDSIFRGKPWIEVVGIKPLAEKMTEPVLIRMVKAFQLKRIRRFDAAASEFNASHVKGLPAFVTAHLHRETGICLAAAERYGEALQPLERAAALRPEDRSLERVLAHCRRAARRPRVVSAPNPEIETPTRTPTRR